MGWTGLHIATQEGHYDFVELLIQYHANFNLETNVGDININVVSKHNTFFYQCVEWLDTTSCIGSG